DQARDLRDGIEVLDARFMGFDRHVEAVFEVRDELEGADRVENAAGDQRRLVGKLGRILAGQELVQDVGVHGVLDLVHGGLLLGKAGGSLSQLHSAPNPAARSASKWGSVSITGLAP